MEMKKSEERDPLQPLRAGSQLENRISRLERALAAQLADTARLAEDVTQLARLISVLKQRSRENV